MIRRLAYWLAVYCVSDKDTEELEIVAYGLECRIADAVQLLVLVAAALITGRPLVLLACR